MENQLRMANRELEKYSKKYRIEDLKALVYKGIVQIASIHNFILLIDFIFSLVFANE